MKKRRRKGRRPKKEAVMLPHEYPEEMPPRDAARYLHTTERTLHEWTKDGKIAHMRLSPKKIVYRRADLDEYKQSCHVAAKRSPAPAA